MRTLPYRNFLILSFLFYFLKINLFCYILLLSLGRYQTKIRMKIVMIHGTFLLTISEGGVAYGSRYCNDYFICVPNTHEISMFISSKSGSLPKSSLENIPTFICFQSQLSHLHLLQIH